MGRPRWWRRLTAWLGDPEMLRSWGLVANDGVISTAGILQGFAGAGAVDRTLVLAATTATVAGMLSVGGAEWAEAAAEREAQLTALAEEVREQELDPHAQRAEVEAYYLGKGLSPELATRVADELAALDPISAQLESEHGILAVTSRSETVALGVGSGLAFGAGAAIPLLITIVTPAAIEPTVILAAVLGSLVLTSVIGARAGRMRVLRTVVRTLAVGVGTMAVSYLVGQVVF